MRDDTEFYKQDINDLQAIIRAQDTKIGYLFVICFLPINQLSYFQIALMKLGKVVFLGNIFLAVISISWLLSVVALIFGIYPRFSKKLIDPTPVVISEMQKDRNFLHELCKTKITCVKIALWAITVWATLLVLTVIGLI